MKQQNYRHSFPVPNWISFLCLIKVPLVTPDMGVLSKNDFWQKKAGWNKDLRQYFKRWYSRNNLSWTPQRKKSSHPTQQKSLSVTTKWPVWLKLIISAFKILWFSLQRWKTYPATRGPRQFRCCLWHSTTSLCWLWEREIKTWREIKGMVLVNITKFGFGCLLGLWMGLYVVLTTSFAQNKVSAIPQVSTIDQLDQRKNVFCTPVVPSLGSRKTKAWSDSNGKW